jgi:hypothetical protein
MLSNIHVLFCGSRNLLQLDEGTHSGVEYFSLLRSYSMSAGEQ